MYECGDLGDMLPYDTAAYEHGLGAPSTDAHAWNSADLLREVASRADRERARRELRIRYYRIGYTLAFPLPPGARPSGVPPDATGVARYPWMVWLSWALEERWRTLRLAWRHLGDAVAGRLLREEVAALAGWSDYLSDGGEIHLATGHLAACLNLCLSCDLEWEPEARRRVVGAAESLVGREVMPWFERRWAHTGRLQPADLHNIPWIVLVRAAELARTLSAPSADRLAERAHAALAAWCDHRVSPVAHSEGPAYDGYLMDSVTEWLGPEPRRQGILQAHRDAFASLVQSWTHLSLPGRPDLLAPLGDVEPQMCFHIAPLLRLLAWRPDGASGAVAAATTFPLRRMPAAALEVALDLATGGARLESESGGSDAPNARHAATSPEGAAVHPAAVSLRGRGSGRDALVAVGATRSEVGHLHCDGGHVVFGWRRRFWITDPGYQQYRDGSERDYTLGVEAHNAPVISDRPQARRATVVTGLRAEESGHLSVRLDLTACYEGLPRDARVERTVRLLPSRWGPVVTVGDAVAPDLPVVTHWHGGGRLAWAFVDGWARLSDGEAALWIGRLGGPLTPSGLHRHEGSRGSLTLTVPANAGGGGRHLMVFCGQSCAGWRAPELEADDRALTIALPDAVHRLPLW